MPRPDVEFDDVIYHLQRNRGASLYWRELGHAVARARPGWWITRRAGRRRTRLFPVLTTAKVFHSSLFRAGVGRDVANVVTIHDLTYEKGLVSGPRARVGLAQRRSAVRAADGLVFISERTRHEFEACYPAAAGVPAVVAWHGRDLSWDQSVPGGLAVPEGLQHERYVLHVGHREGYKNFGLALDGYVGSAARREGWPLVVLGPPPTRNEHALVARRRMATHVRWSTAADRLDLRRFMEHAYALLYVSREEGFGMPIVESMQLGVPVIAADASCLPEIGGSAALLVDPDDPSAVAAALDRLSHPDTREDVVRRGKERARQFSWDASAAAHIELYENVGGL